MLATLIFKKMYWYQELKPSIKPKLILKKDGRKIIVYKSSTL